MQLRRAASVAGVLSLVVGGLTAASASATVVRDGAFSGTDEYVYSDCGYPIHVDVEFSGTLSVRFGKGRDAGVVFVHERLNLSEEHTRAWEEDGPSFVLRANRTFQDIRATQVEGSIYELTSHEVGQPFVIEDSSGRVVARDRGAINYHALIDVAAEDPDDMFVEFLGADVHGPHPGFFTDLCSYAGELIGISTSSERIALHPAGTTDSPLGYGEYLPPDYDAPGGSPLLVALHGLGDSGDGSFEQLQNLAFNAIPKYVAYDGWPDDRPFVVLAPQHRLPDDFSQYDAACEGSDFFGSCAMMLQHILTLANPAGESICFTPTEIHDFITYAVDAYDVDPHRVYLTGLSCGAFGGWEYLAEHGDEQVAAAVLIAGEGRPAFGAAGCALGDVPIWAFHGLLDIEVDPQGSIAPIEALQACGAPDAELTIYSDADHDSWTRTYAVGSDVDIYSWMLGFTNP